jgi:hypothetical protein
MCQGSLQRCGCAVASLRRLDESAWSFVHFCSALRDKHWYARLVSLCMSCVIPRILGSTIGSLVVGQVVNPLFDVPNNDNGAMAVFSTVPGLVALAVSLLSNIFSSCAIDYKAW